jgi:23S rRNA (cytosine1962-C5)-methyltransferase
MSYILNSTIVKDFGGKAEADEIGLRVSENGLVLPCGSTAIWKK